ncbi:MAG: hypothetical protein IKB98_10100, partial [Clostridia bacterium]|nr:hypothetical protein [Clostridia bacterium]
MDNLKPEDIENLKIGFCLELHFRQDSISEQLKSLSDFIKTNENLFSVIDIPTGRQRSPRQNVQRSRKADRRTRTGRSEEVYADPQR